MTKCVLVGLVVVFMSPVAEAQKDGEWGTVRRLEEVAGWLKKTPRAPGRPLSDRAAWRRLAAEKGWSDVVRRAERTLKQPLPDQPDDLFLDFSRTGNRKRWERVANQRRRRVTTFVLAECLENSGRFLPALEATIRALCAEKTWLLPAHDGSLSNFHGQSIDIDLGSSRLAWDLAITDALLGEKLEPKTRRLLRAEVERRVLRPFRDMATGRRKPNWWMHTTNNWNAVCLAGVTGAALALVKSRQDRAFFIVAAESFSRNFLRGFTRDGYCSEGLGYWNYGFGNYVKMVETVWQATGGHVDLLENPHARVPALFGSKLELVGGVYPAFADCHPDARPDGRLMGYVSRRLGLGLVRWEKFLAPSSRGGLPAALLFSFSNSATRARLAKEKSHPQPLRTWFDVAGVLVCRPGSGDSQEFACAMKGGHNGEHHNHNDVGSFCVAVGDRPVLVDPGSEVYTRRTFSRRRYESNVLNSFGHPVPRVAGQLQRTGRKARARVLRKAFADASDTLVLDLRPAYPVPDVLRLERTFVYARAGKGSLSVADAVQFRKPESFGTALITFGTWTREKDGSLLVKDGDRAVRVEIDTSGAAYEINPQVLDEDLPGRRKPTRLGIDIARPVKEATITLRITPVG